MPDISYDSLLQQLDLVEEHARLAREDLESGSYRRVLTELRTIGFIGAQAEESIKSAALAQVEAARDRGRERNKSGRPTTKKGEQTSAAIIGILAEAGEPLHIQELMEKMVQGVGVPGQGKAANLIAYLRRIPEIVRVDRGVYGLKEWSVEAVR